MTRKGDFVLRQIADEYVLIPYGGDGGKDESGTHTE